MQIFTTKNRTKIQKSTFFSKKCPTIAGISPLTDRRMKSGIINNAWRLLQSVTRTKGGCRGALRSPCGRVPGTVVPVTNGIRLSSTTIRKTYLFPGPHRDSVAPRRNRGGVREEGRASEPPFFLITVVAFATCKNHMVNQMDIEEHQPFFHLVSQSVILSARSCASARMVVYECHR